MNGKYLLDTNILIAIFAGDTPVLQRLAGAEAVFVPSIALGELYYGARRSTRVATNTGRIDAFAASNIVLACTIATAQHYGAIKQQLRTRGTPIPENDLWIAAIATQHRLTLVSRDVHFNTVAGLATETW